MKTRSTEIKKSLVGYKIVTEIVLHIIGGRFLSFFTETASEVPGNKKKLLEKFKTTSSQKKFIQSLNTH